MTRKSARARRAPADRPGDLAQRPLSNRRPAAPRGHRQLAAGPAPRERVPVWLLAATFAATAIWEDRFALEWLARCEDLARRTER